MKSIVLSISLLFISLQLQSQNADRVAIKITLNNYVDGFYKGDANKLKAALKPRLYKFGYLKDKTTGKYEYYEQMTFEQAIAFVNKMKDEGRSRDETEIRKVEILDVGNHIASAKITAAWGIDYALLSKDNGQWRIEQVIWEGPYIKEPKNTGVSTYYLIRHADKDRSNPDNKNPELTEEGHTRAKLWAEKFKDTPFDGIYSTNFKRTWQTAFPVAKSNKKRIVIYNPKTIDVEKFIENTQGQTVLIVGHSNSTPTLANALLGEDKYKAMEETNYAGLYIITISDHSRSSVLLQLE